MDIHELAIPTADEALRQNPHETSQHDEIDIAVVKLSVEFIFEFFARREVLVIDTQSRDAVRSRCFKSLCIWTI